MIDFAPTDRHRELQQRVDAFGEKQIIPDEKDPRVGPHGPSQDLRREQLFRQVRVVRSYDGASEVNRRAIARRILRSAEAGCRQS